MNHRAFPFRKQRGVNMSLFIQKVKHFLHFLFFSYVPYPQSQHYSSGARKVQPPDIYYLILFLYSKRLPHGSSNTF